MDMDSMKPGTKSLRKNEKRNSRSLKKSLCSFGVSFSGIIKDYISKSSNPFSSLIFLTISFIISVRRLATLRPTSVIIIFSSLNNLLPKCPTAHFLYISSSSGRYKGIFRLPENAAQRKIPNAPSASSLSASITQCNSIHVSCQVVHLPV